MSSESCTNAWIPPGTSERSVGYRRQVDFIQCPASTQLSADDGPGKAERVSKLRALYKRHGHTLWQFMRFGIVGGSGVLVNMVVTVIMNRLNGGSVFAQNVLWSIPGTPFNVRFSHAVWIVAFLVANLWNFQLNRTWTFRSAKAAGWYKEFWPFLAVGSVAAAVGLLIKILLTNPSSPLYLPEPWFHEDAGLNSREYWGQLIAVVLTMPINFVVNKLWTFRAVRRVKSGLPDADTLVAEVKEGE